MFIDWLNEMIKLYEKQLNKINLNEYQRDFYSGKLEAFEKAKEVYEEMNKNEQ